MDITKLQKGIQAIAAAPRPPLPWQDATQLPWHDQTFSERMLRVHLDQSTHMASRTREVIHQHVRWLWRLLQVQLPHHPQQPHVLDLGCGPGFYCHELARRGGRATGCDFAPVPLAHARHVARESDLDCRFLAADLTTLPAGFAEEVGPVDAVTFWFGEFHSFPPPVAARILRELMPCLKPGGLFVLEFQPYDLFPRHGSQEWQACETSVFSDEPHLWLQEFHWDDTAQVEIHVHWILDAATCELTRYAQCHQAYGEPDLVKLFAEAGLVDPRFHPPISGIGEQFEFPLLVTRKKAGTDSF